MFDMLCTLKLASQSNGYETDLCSIDVFLVWSFRHTWLVEILISQCHTFFLSPSTHVTLICMYIELTEHAQIDYRFGNNLTTSLGKYNMITCWKTKHKFLKITIFIIFFSLRLKVLSIFTLEYARYLTNTLL